MKRLKSLAIIGLTVATLGLVGCSGSNSNENNNTSIKTRVVETEKGEVEIPTEPKKIVDISGNSEELALLGYTPVGTANVDSYQTESVPSYMKDTLGNAKVVGHSMMDTMDIEAILELEPDLIIMAPRQEKIYDQLKEIAPVVMVDDEYNDWESKLMDIAEIFEKEDEANAWLDKYYVKAKEIGAEINAANKDESYITVLASSGQFMVFSEAGLGTVLRDDMGLKQPVNMPEQDSITLPTVTMEGLAEIDADNIIVIGTESDKADLENSAVFKEIRAVKEGNVTILDASPYFSQPYNPIGRELILETIKDELVK
ncbi:MAG: iron-hydroxamate ABC transporter substrate-binding protein [Peptostreptococcaceae bacterium]